MICFKEIYFRIELCKILYFHIIRSYEKIIFSIFVQKILMAVIGV